LQTADEARESQQASDMEPHLSSVCLRFLKNIYSRSKKIVVMKKEVAGCRRWVIRIRIGPAIRASISNLVLSLPSLSKPLQKELGAK
jgi:hypothetical protein